MARKNLMDLRAVVSEGAVRLTFYKGTPLFEREKGPLPLRLWRRAEPDFVFGADYAEYFSGIDWRTGEVIFEGTLECTNQRKFTYIDTTAGIGFTGAYWVQLLSDDEALGPAPVRVRDPYVWWPYDTVRQQAEALARDFPGRVQVEPIGRTVGGRPLIALRAGQAGPTVAFIGLVHAGEAGPELLLPMLRRLLTERPDLLGRAGVAVLPSLNPDEREEMVRGVPWYRRTNRNGVDLNRNFAADWDEIGYGYGLDSSDPAAATYRGPLPASEPETLAAVRFLEVCRPAVVFSFHCLASICSNAFLTTAKGAGDAAFAEAAQRFAAGYDRGMFPEATGKTTVHYACCSGSLPHWVYRRLAVPAFDLELGPDPDAKVCVRDGTTRDLLDTYRGRHFGGLVKVLEFLSEGRSP